MSESRIDEAKRTLAKHFRSRTAPRFFLTPDEIAKASAHVPAAWREQTLAEAGRWRDRAERASKWSDLLEPSGDEILQAQLDLLQFAVPLARAALYGDETATTLERLIGLWKEECEGNRTARGFSSPLLSVYRAVSLSWALAFLHAAGRDTDDLECTLVGILLADAEFINDQLGTSFPNNHLLADGFGLWYLGTLMPEFARASEWRRAGEEVWLRELERQVHPDGTSFEHAVHYQEFACEMGVLYWLLGERNASGAPQWVAERIRGMLHFLDAIGGGAGRMVPFGDYVEGVLIPLDSTCRLDSAVYGELGAALFEMPSEIASEHGPSERAFWLLGDSPVTARPPSASHLEGFPHGGVHVFSETDRTSRLVFRTGPAPGSEVNPGHMHADLMSVYLDVAGEPLIVEAGTYTYRSGARQDGVDWRAYFLGPSCHNGLLIANEDPLARGAGDFPSGPPQSYIALRAVCEDARVAWAEGENTGTTRYAGHRRGVIHVRERFWIVYDALPEGLPIVDVSMGLQLAPQVDVTVLPRAIRIAGERAGCWCVPDESFGPVTARRGELNPPAGWVSTRYGQLEPATQLRFGPVRSAPVHAFLLQPMTAADSPPWVLNARQDAAGALAFEVVDAVGSASEVVIGGGAVTLTR